MPRTNKKTAVPTRGTAVSKINKPNAYPRQAYPKAVSFGAESSVFQLARTLQEGTSSHRQVFWLAPYREAPSHPLTADSGQMPLGFPISISEQAHTAARPSRFWTAFPFDYPKTYSFRTCSQFISLSKNTLLKSLSNRLYLFKQKNENIAPLLKNFTRWASVTTLLTSQMGFLPTHDCEAYLWIYQIGC